MIWLVRAVVKTYKIDGDSVSVKLVEVEADDEKQAKVAATDLIDQQEKTNHSVTCTAVFKKGCRLREYRANITYMATDEFDDYSTERMMTSFYIQAPSFWKARKIAREEAELHLHQYAYFRKVVVYKYY